MEARGAEMMLTRIREWMDKWVQHSPSTTLFWTSLVIISATSLVLFSLGMKLRKPDTVLLAGLNGSGKTVLFYQLRDGCFKQETVQSQEPNEEKFILHSEITWNSKVRPVNVVDLPGNSTMDKFLHKAAAIVFVVDATEISWNFLSVSKYLYEIITKPIVVKNKIPVLILCNKTDMLSAHSKEFIARQLEKSINKLCMSRPGSSDVRREEFLFSNCHTQVTVSEASGLTGDIAQLEIFIRKYLKY